MADTQKPVKPGPAPKATRYPENRFCSNADFKLHEMMCDQIDAGLKDANEFYMKPQNTGFAMLPNGGRQQYFMK